MAEPDPLSIETDDPKSSAPAHAGGEAEGMSPLGPQDAGQQGDDGAPGSVETEVGKAFHDELLTLMKQVVLSLPDETTLGEVVEAARSSGPMAAVLDHMTVQELIDMVKERPAALPTPTPASPTRGEVYFDEEGNPLLELDTKPDVVRRRADVPDGDLVVLTYLAEHGPQSEPAICRGTKLTSEQVRLILRSLRQKSHIHIEGSGAKRRIKITRGGGGYLRRQQRDKNGGGGKRRSRSRAKASVSS